MNIHIRMAAEADSAAILAIYAYYVEETCISFELQTPAPAEFTARIQRTMLKYPFLVAEREGEMIGFAYAADFKERAAYQWSVEVTIYLKNGLAGSGIGSMLYECLENILLAQGFQSLNACIYHPYPISKNFFSGKGFTQAAHFTRCAYKHGRWLDMIWMEKIFSDPSAAPPVLKTWQSLVLPKCLQ